MLSPRWTLSMALAATMALSTIAFGQESAVADTAGDGMLKELDNAAMDTSTAEETAPPVENATEPAKAAAPKAASRPADVAADKDVVDLDKMVVVGYGTVKKSQMTSAVTTVDTKELTRTPSFSVEKALQGKAAGVYVSQNSGAPGKDMTVRIRGVGTINKSGPLYVVDGVPSSSIGNLNPQDIESMSILKDAASAAIYGSRGANGVVLVTTKKGKDGSAVINYEGRFGFQNPWKTPDLCTASEWAELRNEALQNGEGWSLFPYYVPDADGNDSLAYGEPSELGTGTNWFDAILNKNAFLQSHAASVTGGGAKSTYYISGNYSSQEGIIKSSSNRKIGARVNTDNKLYSWLTFGNHFGVSNNRMSRTNESDEWSSAVATALSLPPIFELRDSEGHLVGGDYNTNASQTRNPVAAVENACDTTDETRMQGDLYATVNFFDAVKLNSSFGLDLVNSNRHIFKPKYYVADWDQQGSSIEERRADKDVNWVFENILTFDKELAEVHSLKVMAGFTMQEARNNNLIALGSATPYPSSDALRELDLVTDGMSVSGNTATSRLLSYLGRINYDLLERYNLTASIRADGSSRFAESERWGIYPSVSASWAVSRESFMDGLKPAFSDFKIRGGWGRLGNQDAVAEFPYVTQAAVKQRYVLGGTVVPGSAYKSEADTNISWEKQTSVNVGVDLGVIDNRITGTFDFFSKQTTDMLLERPLPSHVGYVDLPGSNEGEVKNVGFEATLGFKDQIGQVDFDFGANISRYRNEVTKLGENDDPLPDAGSWNKGEITRTEVGQPIGMFYGYKTAGLFQTAEEVTEYGAQPDAVPGDVRFQDLNGDGVIDDGDRTFIGSPHPKLVYGCNVNAAWKFIDLGIFLQGSYGNMIFNATRWSTDNSSGTFSLDKRMKDRWHGEGTTNDAWTPRMTSADANDNERISDRYVEDGSYLRIKSLVIGVAVPQTVAERISANAKLRLYFSVDNLATFTKYSGLDPEIAAGEEGNYQVVNNSLNFGIDRGTYPQSRAVSFGVNLTL